jgi:hypothetical protein
MYSNKQFKYASSTSSDHKGGTYRRVNLESCVIQTGSEPGRSAEMNLRASLCVICAVGLEFGSLLELKEDDSLRSCKPGR